MASTINSFRNKNIVKGGKRCQENEIKVAVGKELVIDPEKNGKAFTENFILKKFTYEELAEEVISGKPIGFDFNLTDEERSSINEEWVTYYKSKKYFKSSEFIVLDFDDDVINNLTLNEIKKEETQRAKFLCKNAGLVHTSPNHRKNGNGDRLHVLFQFPKPIENWEKLKKTHKAFQNKFKASDQAQTLAGAYTTCGENPNAETIILGNRITTRVLDEILSDHDKSQEGKEEPKHYKEIEVVNPERYAKATYENRLEKLSRTHKKRPPVLNAVAYSIGTIQHYLNKSDTEIIQEIMTVSKSIGLHKKYGSRELMRRIEKPLEDGQRDKYNYNIRTTPKHIDDVIQIDSNNQTKLFANEKKPEFMQFPKPILDYLPKAQKEASKFLEDEHTLWDFENFLVELPSVGQPKQGKLKEALKALTSPNAINAYLALYCRAGYKSKIYTREQKIVLANVDLNEIIDILTSNKNLSRQQRYKKRERIKADLQNLNHIIITKKTGEDRSKTKNKTNTKFYPLIDELQIERNKIRCSLPWEWGLIGAHIPKTLFALNGKKKKEKSLLIELYRRGNQLYTAKKEDGYKPPIFKSVTFKLDYLLEVAKLDKTFAANPTMAKKRLKSTVRELVNLNILKKIPRFPSAPDTRVIIYFQDQGL